MLSLTTKRIPAIPVHYQNRQHHLQLLAGEGLLGIRWLCSSVTPTTSTAFPHRQPLLSLREVAHLEERLCNTVAKILKDPILQVTLQSLQWWPRRLQFDHHEDGANKKNVTSSCIDPDKNNNSIVKVVLQLPSLLHPQLSQLQEMVQYETQQQVEMWRQEQNHTNNNNKKQIPFLSVQVQMGRITHPVPYSTIMNTTTQPSLDDNNNNIALSSSSQQPQQQQNSSLGPGLQHVAHIVAVYSCKGGVGKSTMAVNLAYELARLGGRIGLLDVDVYGPSLPVLVHPDDRAVRKSPLGPNMVMPIEHRNVKLLSLGFVSPKSGVPGSGPDSGAAIMRGPMAGRVVTQLLKGTDWGDLDILLLDLPPGTGDVPLTVCQEVVLSGAIAVSTPSKLAAVDTKKGIDMFTSLGVPTMAVIENMSYFVCEGGGMHFPFGKGLQGLTNVDNVGDINIASRNVFQLPISTLTNDANDTGQPLCLTRPKEAQNELDIFHNVANALSKEILLLQYGHQSHDTSWGPQYITFEGNSEQFPLASLVLSLVDDHHKSSKKGEESFVVRLFSESGAMQLTVSARDLQQRDPKTGEKQQHGIGDAKSETTSSTTTKDGMVLVYKSSSSKLFPATIDKKGRYGYAVTWANGATIIYSRLAIAKAAGAINVT